MIPDYLVSRVLNAGLCRYSETVSGLTLYDLFRMHDYLDVNEWVEEEKHSLAERLNANRR
jgi:hypothetical protein